MLNASVYISDPSILGSNLFDQIKEIRSYKDLSGDGKATGFILTLDSGVLTVNFMPQDQINNHLKGFSAYAENIIEDKEELIRVLSRISHVRFVLGCVFSIEPGAEDQMREFILAFNSKLNGLLFMDDTIFE